MLPGPPFFLFSLLRRDSTDPYCKIPPLSQKSRRSCQRRAWYKVLVGVKSASCAHNHQSPNDAVQWNEGHRSLAGIDQRCGDGTDR